MFRPSRRGRTISTPPRIPVHKEENGVRGNKSTVGPVIPTGMASQFCSTPKPGGSGTGPRDHPRLVDEPGSRETGDSHECAFRYRFLSQPGASEVTHGRSGSSDRPLGRIGQAVPARSPLYARSRPEMARKAWTARGSRGLRPETLIFER